MFRKLFVKTISNIRVGRAKVKMDRPSHVPGVREGNRRGAILREIGITSRGSLRATATARRSTGIQPGHHNPIDPRMPVLTPS